MAEIPTRVTLRDDGVYIWSVPLDMKLEREGYRMGGKIWTVAALLLIPVGLFFSLRNRSVLPFIILTGFAAVILLITFGVVRGLENWPGERRRTYRMMDELISTGFGRRTGLFEFRKAQVMIVGPDYIDLRGRFIDFRACVPPEDLELVRSYIQERVPKACEIRYVEHT
ncbi:MAG: hypothetical protein IJH38_06590 [Clostridia bacterium]|nr:hypothetical protein [Clostridia bacterium]